MKKVVPLTAKLRYRGVFPVVPTVFTADGRLDLDGQKCCVDFVARSTPRHSARRW